jgi:putative membrane protein
MMFFGGLLLVGIGLAIAYALGLLGSKGGMTFGKREETPLEILKRRYARGEIDKDEYDRTRQELMS